MKAEKFLSKKRNRIFSIKKYEKGEMKDKHQKYSLIEISKLVLDYIKKEKNKTGNEITEYILKSLVPGKDKKIQKNIQRRVYDAINIMNAAGLIQKNKQQVKYIPLKEKNKEEKNIVLNINENNEEKKMSEINALNQEYLDKLKQLNFLRQILLAKYFKLQGYENQNKINNNKTNNKKNNLYSKRLIKKNKIGNNKKDNISIIIDANNKNEFKNIKKLKTEEISELDKNNKINITNSNLNIFRINNTNSKEKYNNKKIEENKINIINNNITCNKNNSNEDIVLNYLKKVNLFQNE
jgi:hypothetical protein